MKQGGSKTFQKRYYRNRECLSIAKLVNTRVAEITKYQPHGSQINYYLSKELKQRKKGVLVISNDFRLSIF